MKYSELIDLDSALLIDKLILLEKELFKLKFQHSIRQIENTSKIAILRKDIARVNTAITFKQNIY